MHKTAASLQHSGSLTSITRARDGFGAHKGCGLLDKLTPEKKSGSDRKICVEANQAVEKMNKAFEDYCKRGDGDSNDQDRPGKWTGQLWLLRMNLEMMEGTARDVAIFAAQLGQYINMSGFRARAGYFLSALIDTRAEEDFSISLESLGAEKIYNFGYLNRKNVVVIGDLGHYAGKGMLGGTLNVRGSVWNAAGHGMSGGKLEVSGNAGRKAGQEMSGGTLHIRGDCGNFAGVDMNGSGTILVDGNAGEYAGNRIYGGTLKVGGKIASALESAGGWVWERGKLVIASGKRVG